MAPKSCGGSPTSGHLAEVLSFSLPQFRSVLKYTQHPAAWIIFHPGGMPEPAPGMGSWAGSHHEKQISLDRGP